MRIEFAVATPTAIIAPIRPGTLKVVPVSRRASTESLRGTRQRHEDDERVEPTLVFSLMEQVDEHD